MDNRLVFIILLTCFCSFGQSFQPSRISCEVQKKDNARMTFPRSDAQEFDYPFVFSLNDPQLKPFKRILSHQIIYSTDDLIVFFLIAEDVNGKLGNFKAEINTSLKIAKTQLLNFLPDKLKDLSNKTFEVPFRLFNFSNGLIIFPANEVGVWKLMNLNTRSVIKQWTHPVGYMNPQISDKFITWTYQDSEKSHLFLYNLKTDESRTMTLDGEVQVLGTFKNELFYVNIDKIETNKRIFKVYGFLNGINKLRLQLDSSKAEYGTFLMVNNIIFYTSQKAFGDTFPLTVTEAQLNLFDVNRGIPAPSIPYANFMIELLRKYGHDRFRLLNTPFWNHKELIFSLNEIGGLIKFDYNSKQWFYLGYPYDGKSCFNPSFAPITD